MITGRGTTRGAPAAGGTPLSDDRHGVVARLSSVFVPSPLERFVPVRLALRSVGWLLVGSGVLIALYLVYSLYWTGLTTSRAQERLLDDWVLEVGEIPGAEDPLAGEAPETLSPVDVGEAVAALQFHRPGSPDAPVYSEPLLIVEGVTDEALETGPGHYPGTAYPGEPGNFAIAGHRTTFGAPFYDLDQLEPGDEIHVSDRSGHRWVYEVVTLEIVGPADNHVLARDPLELGRPMLTLTTCNPRWSNRERLIAFAQLTDGQTPASA